MPGLKLKPPMNVHDDYLEGYDSGWFAIAASTDYTLTHNVGMIPRLITVLVGTDGDDDDDAIQQIVFTYHNALGVYIGGRVAGITKTQLTLSIQSRTHYDSAAWQASGYARVFARP